VELETLISALTAAFVAGSAVTLWIIRYVRTPFSLRPPPRRIVHDELRADTPDPDTLPDGRAKRPK
jgi:hypothetical protein